MSLMSDAGGVIIKESAEIIGNIFRAFDWINNTEIMVGISSATSGRDGPLTNAQLMYLHTNGSPVHHIPARPVIEPALEAPETYKKLNDIIVEGMGKAFAGDLVGAMDCYEKAGMEGAAAAQDYITGGGLAPNAPATVARKGSSQPLIDTGALRQSITYVVRKK